MTETASSRKLGKPPIDYVAGDQVEVRSLSNSALWLPAEIVGPVLLDGDNAYEVYLNEINAKVMRYPLEIRARVGQEQSKEVPDA